MNIRLTNRKQQDHMAIALAAAGLLTTRQTAAEAGMKRFDATVPFKTLDEWQSKKVTAIKDAAGHVVDYRDVTISGYLSTFADANGADRHGEYVEKGAFRDTLRSFMERNPVMLRDHTNRVEALVGKFVEMTEDENGLRIVGQISNAPDVQSVRFKVAEGILKTMSIGGVFHYKEDKRGIFKVDLYEGSLTPVPANPKCVISVRSLTDQEVKFIKSGMKTLFYEFMRAETGAKP